MLAQRTTRAAMLRNRLGDATAPLTAQYALDLLWDLPTAALNDVASQPNARVLRTHMRQVWKGREVQLEATRRDLREGIAFLARHDILSDLIAERSTR